MKHRPEFSDILYDIILWEMGFKFVQMKILGSFMAPGTLIFYIVMYREMLKSLFLKNQSANFNQT